MTDHPSGGHIDQPAPDDVERLQVLSRLILGRIAELCTARGGEKFTPELARELFVLEQLRDDWLYEARGRK